MITMYAIRRLVPALLLGLASELYGPGGRYAREPRRPHRRSGQSDLDRAFPQLEPGDRDPGRAGCIVSTAGSPMTTNGGSAA